MNTLMLISLFLFNVFAQVSPLGTFSGRIVRQAEIPYLEIKPGTLACLKTDVEDLLDDLNRLSKDDLVRIRAFEQNECLNVFNFEHIQLSKLVGFWINQKSMLFHFTADQHLIIDNPFTLSDKRLIFKYQLFPGRDEFWALIIANENSTYIGLIELQTEQAIIKYINQKNPDHEEHFDLRRLN